jgi:C4-dicarboxylate-specific signal transduction histidine kinase
MDLSMNDLIRLFKMASLGKVTGGLIHNINGPLQNIGLDLEMSQYMLRKEADDSVGTESNIMVRLKRIEDELERLNSIIKTSTNKIMQADNSLQNFNEFIEQELSFLNTNLYYKHNVETALQLDAPPPLMSVLPENSILAFGWLLQRVIEELENLKWNRLSITTEKKEDLYTVNIEAKITNVTNSINDILKSADLNSDNLPERGNETVLMLIMKIFHSEGVIIKTGQSSSDKLVIGFLVGD